MKKEFIPYNLALELKELGFDEPCIGFYKLGDVDIYYGTIIQEKNHKFRNNTGLNIYGDLKEKIAAPTYSQTFRWFREKYGYYISVFRTHDSNWGTDLWLLGVHKPKATVFSETYEEAELACLEKLIEIVKEKK
jgi:hypothetical protein